MSKGDWFKLIVLAGVLYYVATRKKRETIPSWGDSGYTG